MSVTKAVAETPVIQVLSRKDYQEQHLVSLSNTFPLPKLAPSSIRVKTSVLSLTTNNLTYGRIGHILKIWEIYPLPPSIPAEYSDPTLFGRIGAWGYGTVTESNVSEIELGAQVFGLLPIGTLPVDMEIEVNPQIPGQFLEVSKEREDVMPLYNQYVFYPPVSQQTQTHKESQAYDTLFHIFFTTSYLINRFIFPWESAELVHPNTVEDGWNIEKGTIDSNTAVLIFADSGKTALSLAYLLKNCRPAGTGPRMVVGIGSNASRSFANGTGLYDKILTYDSDTSNLEQKLNLSPDSKVIVCEFGSRGNAGERWANKLRKTRENVVLVSVAGEVLVESPEKATETFFARTKSGATVFNASRARIQAMEVLGEKIYTEALLKEWLAFKERGLVAGLQIVWGKGMEGVGGGWEKLCKGEVGSDQGLVFVLD